MLTLDTTIAHHEISPTCHVCRLLWATAKPRESTCTNMTNDRSLVASKVRDVSCYRCKLLYVSVSM